jgi:hypothetical protein
LAQVFLQTGDLKAAEAAAYRAEESGEPLGSYLLAIVYRLRHQSSKAHDMILRAVDTAGSKGDTATLALAMQALRPYGLRFWRARPLLAIALVAVLAAVGALAGWQWAVAAGALLVAFVLSQRPIVPGMPQEMPETEQGIALAGLSASASLGGPDLLPGQREPPSSRVATRRDHTYWRRTVSVVALTAVTSLVWAADLFSGSIMLRVVFFALAVLTLLFIAWQWPHIGVEEPNQAERTGADQLAIKLTFAPGIFWWMNFNLYVTHPALKSLVECSRERAARRAPRSPMVARFEWAAPPLAGAAVLVTLAVAPGRQQTVEGAASLAGMAIEAIVILYGLGIAWKRARRAIVEHDLFERAWAIGYLLALGAVFFVAYLLDLFSPWRELFA